MEYWLARNALSRSQQGTTDLTRKAIQVAHQCGNTLSLIDNGRALTNKTQHPAHPSLRHSWPRAFLSRVWHGEDATAAAAAAPVYAPAPAASTASK